MIAIAVGEELASLPYFKIEFFDLVAPAKIVYATLHSGRT